MSKKLVLTPVKGQIDEVRHGNQATKFWDGGNLPQKENELNREHSEDRKEIQRMVDKLNKRISRLEQSGLHKYSHAYQYLTGEKHFSIKNKHGAELRQEKQRMLNFEKQVTSSVKGLRDYTKQMAKIVGMDYKEMKNAPATMNKFFQITEQIQNLLNDVHNMGSAIGYQIIFESVKTFVQTKKIELSEFEGDLSFLSSMIVDDVISDYEKTINMVDDMFYEPIKD